ncbi:hypothetical protein [Brevibacillus sp. AY1]|uniref:hypothetical protein n=1 Tax=Brevibacillus sp. AY1 TaxID=2807621 RepID=UPI002458E183|nr:hypothetical protein [Brevibacillus sp. AY1]MDH4616992.1 hypothetical protein [Brevibacillus sp. AY1]
MSTYRQALQAKERLVKRWHKMPGVVGIGVGFANGLNRSGGMCVVMYTLNASASIRKSCPRSVAVRCKKTGRSVQVPVQRVTSGRCSCHPAFKPRATSRSLRSRIRPVVAGYSVGRPGISGTAGLIVARAANRAQRFLLSNNHVLNRHNTGGYTETLQPGGADGGRYGRDRIGRLYRFVRLSRSGVNYLDAALSIPLNNRMLAPTYARVGRIRGYVRSYSLGSRLKKVGRTTGLVSGVVTSINTDVAVAYGSYGGLGTIRFRNQTVIRSSRANSLPGDSGSVWLTSGNRAAAVNFAGSEDGRFSISFPIQWAMQAFGIRTAGAVASKVRAARSTRLSHTASTRCLSKKELSEVKKHLSRRIQR